MHVVITADVQDGRRNTLIEQSVQIKKQHFPPFIQFAANYITSNDTMKSRLSNATEYN